MKHNNDKRTYITPLISVHLMAPHLLLSESLQPEKVNDAPEIELTPEGTPEELPPGLGFDF